MGNRLVEISTVALNHLKTGLSIKRLMGSGTDAAKLLSSATLFSYASRGGVHEELFASLKEICEIQLKRKDDKSIDFCEASLLLMNDESERSSEDSVERDKESQTPSPGEPFDHDTVAGEGEEVEEDLPVEDGSGCRIDSSHYKSDQKMTEECESDSPIGSATATPVCENNDNVTTTTTTATDALSAVLT